MPCLCGTVIIQTKMQSVSYAKAKNRTNPGIPQTLIIVALLACFEWDTSAYNSERKVDVGMEVY